jgi:glutathione peroxidase-family protein
MSAFHDLEMKSIDGELVQFAGFKGKQCLIVNVASR